MKSWLLLVVPVLSLAIACTQRIHGASHVAADTRPAEARQWWALEGKESQSDCPDWPTVGLYQCGRRKLEAAEREMNAAFEQTVAAMRRSYVQTPTYPEDKTEALTLLQQGQDAWKRFRDADCGAAAAVHFAPSANTHGLAELECAAFATRQRTIQLREEFLRYLPPAE